MKYHCTNCTMYRCILEVHKNPESFVAWPIVCPVSREYTPRWVIAP